MYIEKVIKSFTDWSRYSCVCSCILSSNLIYISSLIKLPWAVDVALDSDTDGEQVVQKEWLTIFNKRNSHKMKCLIFIFININYNEIIN